MQPNATPTTQQGHPAPAAAAAYLTANAVRGPAAIFTDAGPDEPARRFYIRVGGERLVGYRA